MIGKKMDRGFYMRNEITEKLEKIIKKENILKNEPMSRHTSFRIGGIADYYIKVESEEELRNVLKFAKLEKIPFYIIGNGTNLLVREGRYSRDRYKIRVKRLCDWKTKRFCLCNLRMSEYHLQDWHKLLWETNLLG